MNVGNIEQKRVTDDCEHVKEYYALFFISIFKHFVIFNLSISEWERERNRSKSK